MNGVLILMIAVGVFGCILFFLSIINSQVGEDDKSDKINISSRRINLNDMTRSQFSRYCIKLLPLNGFEEVHTALALGDKGLDILAERNGEIYGIRGVISREHELVGADEVLRALSGSRFFGCDRTVVVSNWDFDKSARALARRENVFLWDREILTEMIHNDEKAVCKPIEA